MSKHVYGGDLAVGLGQVGDVGVALSQRRVKEGMGDHAADLKAEMALNIFNPTVYKGVATGSGRG